MERSQPGALSAETERALSRYSPAGPILPAGSDRAPILQSHANGCTRGDSGRTVPATGGGGGQPRLRGPNAAAPTTILIRTFMLPLLQRPAAARLMMRYRIAVFRPSHRFVRL